MHMHPRRTGLGQQVLLLRHRHLLIRLQLPAAECSYGDLMKKFEYQHTCNICFPPGHGTEIQRQFWHCVHVMHMRAKRHWKLGKVIGGRILHYLAYVSSRVSGKCRAVS